MGYPTQQRAEKKKEKNVRLERKGASNRVKTNRWGRKIKGSVRNEREG